MRTATFTIVLVSLLSFLAVAQQKSFEEFQQERLAKLQRMQDDFNQFVEERDKKFAKYLRGDFRRFELEPSLRPSDPPKPEDIPTYDEPSEDGPQRQEIDTVLTPLERSRGLLVPPPTKEGNEDYARSAVGVRFYGNLLTFRYDQRLRLPTYDRYEANTIGEAWLTLSQANVRDLLNQLYRRKNVLSLNDWGFFELVKQFATSLYEANDPRAELTTWFLLNKARYKVKLGYYDHALYLLLPSRNTVYSATYYTFGADRYYLFGAAPASLYTYPDDYAGADQTLNMELSSPLNLGGEKAQKVLKFQYAGENYELPLDYNPRAVAFYENYPAVELQAKLESNVSRVAKESWLTQLRPLLAGRTERDQVTLLLRFVQTAFAYQIDEEQFGAEKYFFPEEVLHYAYSDCEDRVALFTYLVRQLVKLPAVCLNYPGHVAAAVQFSEDSDGDFVMLRDDKYIICDPTYVNAPVGKSMDRFARAKPQVLPLQDPVRKLRQEAVWTAAASFGGYPASGSDNVVIDRDGNVYFTGYMLGGNGQTGLDMFVAKVTHDDELAWLEKAVGSGNNSGNYIALDDNQNVYVAGRYEREVQFAAQTSLENDHSGFFVAKYSPSGEVRWARDVPIDVTDNSLQNTFAAKISDQGEVVASSLFDGVYAERGMTVDNRGYIYLMSNAPEATSSSGDTRSFAINSEPEALTAMNEMLRSEDYDPVVASLFALVHCLRSKADSLSGMALQQVLEHHDPSFRTRHPQVYANIGRLRFIRNPVGIITLMSQDGRPVRLDNIYVENYARVTTQAFANGDVRIDVLSGMSVGLTAPRFPLNYVRLFKGDGDLLLDYSDDHTQVMMSLADGTPN